MRSTAFNSFEVRIALVLLSLLLLPTGLVAWVAYEQVVDTIKTDRIKTVGRVADARHEQLNMVFQRAIGRSEGFLAELRKRCGIRATDSTCGRPALRAFLDSEGASGALLQEPGVGPPLVVGDSAAPSGAIAEFLPPQLAQFAARGGERRYFIVAATPDSGMRIAVTYPVQVIQSIFVAHPDLGDAGENFLADGDGYFITKPRYASTQGHSHPISARPMQRCLTPENGETLDVDYRDAPIIHGFRFVPEIGGGCIMAHADQAEAFVPLKTLQTRFVLAMLLFAGLAVAATRYFASRIAGPIKQLTGVMLSIASGNLTIRAEPSGYAELVLLASAFNAMTDRLVEAQDTLELRVLERTALMHESDLRYRSIFENANTGIAATDLSGKITDFNESFRSLLGYDAESLRQMKFGDFTHPDDLALETGYVNEMLAGQREHYRIDKRYIASDGRLLWVDLSVAVVRDVEGRASSFIGVISDMTEHRRNEQKLNLMAKVFTSSGEATVITDADNRIVMVNETFVRLTGYEADEVLGQNPRMLSAGRTPHEAYREMWQALIEHGTWEGELWDRRKTGEIYPKWLSISVVRDADGKVANYVGSFVDISERKASEERVQHLAHHDPLTGLPNRFSLHEWLAQALASAKRNETLLALMLIDLDNFKSINDTLGHPTGDQLLVQVAQRFVASVRQSDLVARLGGDEFVVVLPDVDSPTDVAHVADKILHAVSEPYLIEGQELRTSPSIGICLYPADAEESQDLIKKADVAMYHAKAQGRGNYQFFAEEMQIAAIKRLAIEAELRVALAQQQFVLHYQPQLDLRSGRIVGVEALVRWQHPQRGLVSPLEFISIAEESGLIVPIGDWVMQEACRQLAAWRTRGIEQVRISVNLAASQFADPHLPTRIQEILDQAGLPVDCLDLEVTESMAMGSPADTVNMMKVLTGLGLSLSIDDFGTGYSSLAYLKLFPIDTLKIDRSFVKDIETDPNDADICDVIVLLAHKLGLEVVAEGVETVAQLKYLLSIGCEIVQGYLISKPLAADQAEEFIRSSPTFTGLGTVDLWTQ